MKNNNSGLDERQQQINYRSIAYAGIFLAICVAASMIYKVITTDNFSWEFWAIIGMCFVIIISRRVMGDIEEPKDIMGKPLPLGSDKADKRTRLKDYASRSLIFAGACAVMDIVLVAFGKDDVSDYVLAKMIFPGLNKWLTVALTAVIALAVMFTISFVVDSIIGENFKVKRYNKMLDELDEE